MVSGQTSRKIDVVVAAPVPPAEDAAIDRPMLRTPITPASPRATRAWLWLAGLLVLLLLGIGLLLWRPWQYSTEVSDNGDTVGETAAGPLDQLVAVTDFNDPTQNITAAEVGEYRQVKLRDLKPSQKLLAVDGVYPLERLATSQQTADQEAQNQLLSINQTGVTALSRGMINRLNRVGDAHYFAAKVRDFLSRADYTHTSNEVSFRDPCVAESSMSFCAPWAMLPVLEDSSMNIIGLTGNHGNDKGAEANRQTIDRYEELGWQVVGGGRNIAEARQPLHLTDKGANIAWLGYNYADSPSNYPIATAERAGSNPYSIEQATADIAAAKAAGQFVLVEIQFFECWSYPQGYVEYPVCDRPISGQQETFRQLIDLGADMVVGVAAHQPQTFELYKGKPIYYGLGNLYFDQDEWPGTERSLILTHYFLEGRYIQTRLTPTVFHTELQPRLLEAAEAEEFLARLVTAQPEFVSGPSELATAVENWAEGKNASVAIYNLRTGQYLARHQSTESRDPASLYKLGTVYAGYKAVAAGQHRLDDPLRSEQTWGECLDAAIRTSDSPCGERLWAEVYGGTVNMSVTAEKMTELLRRIWLGQELPSELTSKLLNSLQDQPEKYRRGLPSGIAVVAPAAQVYNKVGWSETLWHDTAIVEQGKRAYAITILTSDVGFAEVAAFSQALWPLL